MRVARMPETATAQPEATAEISVLRCQRCRTVYRRPEGAQFMSDAAAARAVGWTVWEGQTIGGREDRRVFCEACAGRTDITDQAQAEAAQVLAKATTWDAKCNTCDATATEEWAEDLPLSEKDVKNWKSDHQCEPWVELVKPKVVPHG